MKKFVALFLTLALALSLVVPAFAAGATVSLATDKTTVEPGDTVTVKVEISQALSNVGAFELHVCFDSSAFELVGSQKGSSYSGANIAKKATTANGKTFYKVTGMPNISESEESFTVKSGVIYTLTFKALTNASGNKTFSVAVQQFVDADTKAFGVSAGSDVTVTVPVHATGITFDKSSLNLSMKGGANSGTITANVTPADATDEVTWSVTPKGQKIVEISPNGKVCTVMAKAPGTVTITATVNGKSASCTVTVSACDHKSDAGHHHAEVPATCTTTGTKEYWECTECGMKFADQDCKTVLNDLTIAKVPHQFTKADPKADALKTAGTCSAPAVYYYSCASCGAVEKKDSHTFNGDDSTKDPNNHTNVEMQHNDKQHWGYCKDCKANIDKQDHFSNKPANKATCTKKAICDLCNEEYGDLAPHDLKKTNRVDPTCTAPGCKEYWTCNVCKGIFADEQGKHPTTLKDLTIPVANHTESSKYVAGATQHWKFCTVCGEVLTKDDHAYTNGKCVCGATNKDAAVDANHKNHQAGQHNYFNETKHWADCSDPNCAGHVGEANHSLTTKRTIVVNGKTYEVKECLCGYVTRVEVKNNTTGTTTGTNPNAKNPYEKNDTTKKDNGKTVKSGKTFDAGIALYVGLSVLSVTGGALVIGKKKEF